MKKNSTVTVQNVTTKAPVEEPETYPRLPDNLTLEGIDANGVRGNILLQATRILTPSDLNKRLDAVLAYKFKTKP